jgi:Rab3 GTPase-activating protein catalytic subunit
MTEDMIEAQQEALMSEKAENRVLMQSTMLVSDMSAFKAANPGAVFEDFLRWHSPTDFSTETGLSARMTLPGKQIQSTSS